MYDIKNKRKFLNRTRLPQMPEKLLIGTKLSIHARQHCIVDYGDDKTRKVRSYWISTILSSNLGAHWLQRDNMWYHLGAKVYRKNYQMCTKQWSKSKITWLFKHVITFEIGNKSEISEADRSATKRSRRYTVKCDCDSSDWSSIGRQISKSRLRIRMHCRQSRLLSDRSKQVSWVLCWLSLDVISDILNYFRKRLNQHALPRPGPLVPL